MEDAYYLKTIVDPQTKTILELEELIMLESMRFYQNKDIHFLSAPVTTGSISSPMGLGSDSVPVQIKIDNKKTYLADSMQFLLEYGCRIFKRGCWYIMPSFRGEAVDSRHLKQFFHSEAEIVGDLEDVMDLVDEYLRHLVAKSIKIVGNKPHLEQFLSKQTPRITFDEAEKILHKKGIEYKNGWRNISSQGEKALIEHFKGAVWVKNYDKEAVPFYQKIKNNHAKNADLLMGIGEIIGCGERWATAKEVRESLKLHKVSPKEYNWYIKMREHSPIQTSGFGMGIERFLLFILGETDIRKIQIFRRFNDGKDEV